MAKETLKVGELTNLLKQLDPNLDIILFADGGENNLAGIIMTAYRGTGNVIGLCDEHGMGNAKDGGDFILKDLTNGN